MFPTILSPSFFSIRSHRIWQVKGSSWIISNPWSFGPLGYHGWVAVTMQKLLLCLPWIPEPSAVPRKHFKLSRPKWIFRNSLLTCFLFVLVFVCGFLNLLIPAVLSLIVLASFCILLCRIRDCRLSKRSHLLTLWMIFMVNNHDSL